MTELDKQMEDLILDAKRWKDRAIKAEEELKDINQVRIDEENARFWDDLLDKGN